MALDRKYQKIFGGSLTPTGNISVYGTKKEGNVSYSDNLDLIQSNNWLLGMIGGTSQDKAPYLQDLNGIFYTITKQLAYIFQAGISEWNSQTEYVAGRSVVLKNGKIYISKANSTGVEPEVTSGWESSWIGLFDLMLQGIKYNSLPTSIFGNYKKGDKIRHQDEYGNEIIITALKDNPSTPTNSNIYYIKSKLKIEEIVTSDPTASADNLGKFFYNSNANTLKECISYGSSFYTLYEFPLGKFNTLIDKNGKYYDYDGNSATDVSTNYDWIVDYIYLKQQKNVPDGWYKIWSNGIAEQGGVFVSVVPTQAPFMTWKMELFLYAEENDSYAGIIEARANSRFLQNGVDIGTITLGTKIIDGITHRYVQQFGVETAKLINNPSSEGTFYWYIKGFLSPIQQATGRL